VALAKQQRIKISVDWFSRQAANCPCWETILHQTKAHFSIFLHAQKASFHIGFYQHSFFNSAHNASYKRI
jgi:hypothetical protein